MIPWTYSLLGLIAAILVTWWASTRTSDATWERMAVRTRRICEWTLTCEDASADDWSTGCGKEWQFLDGGPVENGISFCPYCGAELVVEETEEEVDA